MEEEQLDHLFERYSADLTDEEAFERLSPEARGHLGGYAVHRMRHGMRNRFLWRVVFGAVPVAAAACVVWLVLPKEAMLGMVTVAGDPADLFKRAGGAEVHDRFWIGIGVKEPCWIHIVERTARGNLVVLRPHPSSDEYAVRAPDRVQLGPFRTMEPNAPSGPSQVTHIMVIAASQALSGDILATSVQDQLAPGRSAGDIAAALAQLAASLKRQHGWEVLSQEVNTSSE